MVKYLPYLFSNILFKVGGIGSEFTKVGNENDKVFVLMLKNS
jgi:hypothetical protein